MTSYSSTYKLHSIVNPNAFDVNSNREQLFVADYSGISLFHISNLSTGAPKVIIPYEQPQMIKKINCIHSEYISILRGGAVSLWDLNNSLKPIKNILHVTYGSSIVDFQVSSWKENILVACTDIGEVIVYDIRASSITSRVTLGSMKGLMKLDIYDDMVAIGNSQSISTIDLRHYGHMQDNSVSFDVPGLNTFAWCNESVLATGTNDGTVSFINMHSKSPLHSFRTSGLAPLCFLSVPSKNSLLISASEKKVSTDDSFVLHQRLSLYKVPKVVQEEFKPASIEFGLLKDSLVGMALINSGQLIAPYDAGIEAILLSPSSVLHAIKIPESLVSTEYSPQMRSRKVSNKLANPVYPVKELRYEVEKSAPLSNSITQKDSTGIDFFMGILKGEVLELQELIEVGELKGLSVGSVDPYAKQVTLIMTALEEEAQRTMRTSSSLLSSSFGHYSFAHVEAAVSLIISFPHKYPHDHSIPTFTLRASQSSSGKIIGLGPEGSALVTELSDVVRRFSAACGPSTHALLVEIARCFRWRVLQLAFGKPELADDEKLFEILPGAFPHSLLEVEREIRDEFLEPLASRGVKRGVIEAKSYRIPCPSTSAAFFSPHGALMCFGAPTLVGLISTQIKPADEDQPRTSYPRSYADMQLILREEEEELEQQSLISTSDDEEASTVNASLAKKASGVKKAVIDTTSEVFSDEEFSYSEECDSFQRASVTYPNSRGDGFSAGLSRGSSPGKSSPFRYLDSDLGKKPVSPAAGDRGGSGGAFRSLEGSVHSAVFSSAMKKRLERRASPHDLKGLRTPGKGFSSSVMYSLEPLRIDIYRPKSFTFVDLAIEYRLIGMEDEGPNPSLMRSQLCRFNAQVALSFHMPVVAQIWNLFGVSFESMIAFKAENCLSPWYISTIGKPLVQELFKMLQNANDLQTLASVIAIAGPVALDAGMTQLEINRVFFAYAKALRSYGANIGACSILKFVPPDSYREAFGDMEFQFDLGRSCGRAIDENKCRHYDTVPMYCFVCEETVKALGIYCPDCYHGGHLEHIKAWFAINGDCPTGCGCICGTRFTFEEDDGASSSSAQTSAISL